MKMQDKQTVLFIDGENFLFPVAKVLKDNGLIQHKSDIQKYSIRSLTDAALKELPIHKTRFYAGKINIPAGQSELAQKSHTLAESQRRLKRSFTNQGVDFIMAGNVRLQATKSENGRTVGVFKEKGTDVRIAVDMLSMACDGLLDTALLLSSDSDMQPVVKELKRRGVSVVYVGFANQVNAGLSQTTDKTILIRETEVVDAWNEANQPSSLTT